MHLFRWISSVTVVTLCSFSASAQTCPQPGQVLINELSYSPKQTAFIELWGPAGTSLGCLELVSANGGPDGTDCSESSVVTFEEGDVFGEDGYFVLATTMGEGVDKESSKADLQNGPDGLSLRRTDTGETLDSVAYGGSLDACDTPVMEGFNPAPSHPDGASIGRAPNLMDTNDNGVDFVLCPSPSPGADNDCPLPPECGESADTILINELQVGPNGSEFVELFGPPGLDLGCYGLRTLNGGSSGDKCDPEEETPLVGTVLDDAGLAVIAIDLQKGPDAVELVFYDEDGKEVSVASVVWKGELSACPDFIGSGDPTVVPPDGMSLSRCGGGGNDATDYIVLEPTPGTANGCPPPCVGPTGSVLINEAVIDPNDMAFVELKGDPGLELRCYAIEELNAGQDGDKCELENQLDLGGYSIGDDGYFTAGAEGAGELDLVFKFAAQNGPDGFRLVYLADAGPVVLDSFSWGGELGACTAPATDSGFGPVVKEEGLSIARCPDGQDTDNNLVDLAESVAATPGAANECPDAPPADACAAPPASVPVLNEIQFATAAQSFIELYAAPGTSLDCFSIVGLNGGPDGTQCESYANVELSGEVVGDAGYFLIATAGGEREEDADLLASGADLQDGPDAVSLLFTDNQGKEWVIDSLVYGAPLPACGDAVGEGAFAEEPGKGKSLTRCRGEDTGDNASDFLVCNMPSPGMVSTCECAEPDPSGSGAVEIDDGGGCHQQRWTGAAVNSVALLGLFLLLLLIARRSPLRADEIPPAS